MEHLNRDPALIIALSSAVPSPSVPEQTKRSTSALEAELHLL